jgi:hypothetical protein
MADLISLDRAVLQLPNAPESDRQLVAALVEACSKVVETYCNRTFAKAEYDELHTVVGPTASLWVNNPPIISIDSVRSSEMPAFFVQFNDPTNVAQRATVEITATAVTLKKTLNGTTTTSSFTFASYPTMTALYNAINTLGGGWAATGMNSQLAGWQTSDLSTNHGTRSARNLSCPISVYWWYLGSYKANFELGEVYVPGAMPGYQTYRVTYTGGFADVPESIQQACAELVQQTYLSKDRNPLMQSETLDKYSYTNAIPVRWFDLLSPASQLALQQYKVPRYTPSGVPARD